MGTIVNTVGCIEPLTIINLMDLQDNGTVLKLRKELRQGFIYKFIIYDVRTKNLCTIKGKYLTYMNDPQKCYNDNHIEYIIVDCSDELKSNKLRIKVSDIKSIDEIKCL